MTGDLVLGSLPETFRCHGASISGVHDVAAQHTQAERHFGKVVQPFADSLFAFRRHKKEHKSASAGTEQLAAQHPGIDAFLIDPIHGVVADGRIELTLVHPRIVEKRPKGARLPELTRIR